MPLDPVALITPGSPEHWMQYLSARLLDRNRTVRLATLAAYRAGRPPTKFLSGSDRKGFLELHRISNSNFARKSIRSKANRMRVRGIRTAAANDDQGDATAWRYWTRSGLHAASKMVHEDQLTFSEGYVRVSQDASGQPIGLWRDPRFCIALADPLDPLKALAGLEMLWDEVRQATYVYLWVREKQPDGTYRGRQYVAVQEDVARPRGVVVPGVTALDMREMGWWWPQLTFNPALLEMRPDLDTVPEAERDGGPYCQTLGADVVPLFRFMNRDHVGEFEEYLSTLDRINRTILVRVVTQAVQAYKQRSLEQELPKGDGQVVDRLAATGKDGKRVEWDEVFQPGPDALWKLPPGVKIKESTESDLRPMLAAAQDDIKTFCAETDTPMPLLSDDVNQSAEGAQFRREDLIFAVEECSELAGGAWAQVIACMFLFAPDSDRYAGGGRGRNRLDRADPGQIVIDWAPPERFSLQERAEADAKNKTLSIDMRGAKIWGLTPAEVAINRNQLKADAADFPETPATPQPSAPPQPPAGDDGADGTSTAA